MSINSVNFESKEESSWYLCSFIIFVNLCLTICNSGWHSYCIVLHICSLSVLAYLYNYVNWEIIPFSIKFGIVAKAKNYQHYVFYTGRPRIKPYKRQTLTWRIILLNSEYDFVAVVHSGGI